jgi:hypothetical protein
MFVKVIIPSPEGLVVFSSTQAEAFDDTPDDKHHGQKNDCDLCEIRHKYARSKSSDLRIINDYFSAMIFLSI